MTQVQSNNRFTTPYQSPASPISNPKVGLLRRLAISTAPLIGLFVGWVISFAAIGPADPSEAGALDAIITTLLVLTFNLYTIICVVIGLKVSAWLSPKRKQEAAVAEFIPTSETAKQPIQQPKEKKEVPRSAANWFAVKMGVVALATLYFCVRLEIAPICIPVILMGIAIYYFVMRPRATSVPA